LYRVQKLSHADYWFRYHTETVVDDKYNDVKNPQLSFEMGKAMDIRSCKSLFAQFPHKVKIDIMGRITKS
jgi:hypothetical protein